MVNWKRGITRLYIVLWALWILVLLIRASPLMMLGNFLSMDQLWPTIVGVAFFGLVVPGCVLIGLRWTIDGFGFEKRG